MPEDIIPAMQSAICFDEYIFILFKQCSSSTNDKCKLRERKKMRNCKSIENKKRWRIHLKWEDFIL